MQKDMKIMVTKLGLLSVRKDTMLVGTVKQIKYRLCLKFKTDLLTPLTNVLLFMIKMPHIF